jgi:peptidoglycan hydrolase-like protein with peptidoglycan-binding domain
MSRLSRAWLEMESCEPVSAGIGAGERAGFEEQAPLEPGSVLGAASSTTRLVKFLAASMLVIVAAPASALAGSVSVRHAKPPTITQVKQQSTPIRPAGVVVLALGSGYVGHGSAAVRALQSRLVRAGYTPGPIDGRFGPRTEQAVARLQAAHGLRVDGIAGPLTLSALSGPSVALGPGAGYRGHGSRAVRALQSRVARAGYTPGPIDGRYGPRTEQAVARLQAAHGLRVDGIAGSQTLAYLTGQAIRRSHPTGSPHRADLRSRRGRSRPQTVSRQPVRAPAARKVVPVSRSTGSSPLGLLDVLLIALAVAVGLSATWLVHRRLHKRYAIADAGANGASSSDADAIAADPDHTTTSDHTTTRRPAAIPNADVGALDDADRAFRHALLLKEHGDQVGAMAAYRRADQLGHGAAAADLGVLLERQGDRIGAKDCFRRAEQRGEASGAFNLADLLEAQGDQMGAMAAYRRADQLGHGAAATNLGVLLEQHGDRIGANLDLALTDRAPA